MQRLLIDTCVLIDFSRGRQQAIQYLRTVRHIPLLVSVMTVAEFCGGLRNDRERGWFDRWTSTVEVVSVTNDVARLGGLYWRDHRDRHGTGLIDALIAATAQVHGARLVTRNARHFPMLDDLLVPYA